MSRIRKANYTVKELKKLLSISENEHLVWMPNEVFKDLNTAFMEYQGVKTSTHYAYAYSYLFLVFWLYRYAKHINNDGIEINEAIIKEILGFSSKSDQYTYITKSQGVLAELGYIKKKTDFPLNYYYEEFGINNQKEVYFEYYSESIVEEFLENRKNKKVNFPIKAFYRDQEAEDDNYMNGTFYDIQNTHEVDINIFIYCMANKALGIEGFYIYCFLKYATDKHSTGFDCSYKKMALLTGFSIDEVGIQLRNLEERNMITSDHKPFCIGEIPEDNKTKANTYTVLNYGNFAQNFWGYNKIPTQRKLSTEQYEREIGFVGSEKQAEFSGNNYV
jgi:hypothetical protein